MFFTENTLNKKKIIWIVVSFLMSIWSLIF